MAKTIKVLISLICVAFILSHVIDKCTIHHSSAGEAQITPTEQSGIENEAYFNSKVSEEWAKLSTWLNYQSESTKNHKEAAEVSPSSLSKFDFHPKMDSSGYDIRRSTLSGGVKAYANECLSIPRCVGFNSNGWLKHTIMKPSKWSQWTSDTSKGLYVRKSSLDEFDFHPKMDSHGYDIRLSTLSGGVEAYANECLSIPRCVGFNSNGWLKHTIMKPSKWSQWTSDTTKGLYVKKGTSPSCKDSPFKFNWRGESIGCDEVKSKRLCATPEVAGQCRATCNICDKCADGTRNFTFVNPRGRTRTRTCKFVARDTSRCAWPGISDTCPLTCKSCD